MASCAVECSANEQRGVVLRVKRKRTDDPVEALVVSHVIPAKRAHVERDDSEHIYDETKDTKQIDQLFRFLGTCNEEDEIRSKDLLKNISTKPTSREDPKKTAKGLADQIQQKKREARKESHSDARFKIISNIRQDGESDNSSNKDSNSKGKSDSQSILSSDDSTDSTDDEVRRFFKVYDVVRDEDNSHKSDAREAPNDPEDTNAILCNSVKMIREKLAISEDTRPADISTKGYVYDFYYTTNSERELGDILEITGVNDDFCLEAIDKEFDEMFDDEDDSNDENNWRNDYPDGDACSSGDEVRPQRRCFDDDYGFNMDDDDGEKYNKKAFGEDLSSDDDDLDCYSEPYKLSSRSEKCQEELSDEAELEGF